MIDTTANHEIAQATEISRLRAALAKIEGCSKSAAKSANRSIDEDTYIWIAETAREALNGEPDLETLPL